MLFQKSVQGAYLTLFNDLLSTCEKLHSNGFPRFRRKSITSGDHFSILTSCTASSISSFSISNFYNFTLSLQPLPLYMGLPSSSVPSALVQHKKHNNYMPYKQINKQTFTSLHKINICDKFTELNCINVPQISLYYLFMPSIIIIIRSELQTEA